MNSVLLGGAEGNLRIAGLSGQWFEVGSSQIRNEFRALSSDVQCLDFRNLKGTGSFGFLGVNSCIM
jgi:hypothetical protein